MNDIEKSYRDVTAGLFWGNRNKMDTVSPQEIKTVQDFITNPREHITSIDNAWNNAQELAKGYNGGMTPEQTRLYKEATQSLIKNFVRITNVFQNHGLWPHYDGKRYRATHDQFMGLAKLAAEFKPNAIGPQVLKFLEEAPSILKEAVSDLKNEKNPTYLDGLYRLVYDSLMDQEGLVTSLDKIVKGFGGITIDPQKGETVSTEDKEKRIKWMGTSGIQQISQAIDKVLVKKRPPEGSPRRGKFDQVVEEATRKVVGADWSSRLKSALAKFGFNTDGSFNRKAFEYRFRQFEDLVKTATDNSSVGDLPELKKEFLGTYESYLKAMEEYGKDADWSKAVTDTYFELILDGKDNLYKALKDLHNTITKETATDSDAIAEDPGVSEKDKPSSDHPLEEGKDPDVGLSGGSGTEPQNEGTSEDLQGSPNEPPDDEPPKENLANEIRSKGSFVEGFKSYHTGAMKAWYKKSAKVDKAWLDATLSQVLHKLGSKLNFSKEALDKPKFLETLIKSQHSPFTEFYNTLDELLYDARPGVTSAVEIAEDAMPSAVKLKNWGDAFYKEVTRLESVPEEEVPDALAEAETSKKEEDPKKTPEGTPEITPEVDAENAGEVLHDLADKMRGEGKLSPAEETRAEEVADVLIKDPGAASKEVPSSEDVQEAESIVDYLKRVEEFVSNKEDSGDAATFARGALGKAIDKARRVLDNKELRSEVSDQINKVMKHLYDNRTSVTSVEEVESLLGNLSEGIDSNLEHIKDILEEVRSKAKAMKSSKNFKLLLKTDSIAQKSADIWKGLSITPVREDTSKEVPDETPVWEEESTSEHRDLGADVHSALLGTPPEVYDVADIVAIYLQYGQSEYMGDGVLNKMGVSGEALNLLNKSKAIGGRLDSVNKKAFLDSLESFAKALGDKTDFDKDPELYDEYESMMKDLKSGLETANPVVKTASTPLLNRVLESFLNKKASNMGIVTVQGYPGSVTVDSSDKNKPEVLRGAIGRILAREGVPNIGRVTMDIYNRGSFSVRDSNPRTPPRSLGNPFKENYVPPRGVPRDPKTNPNQQSLF